VDSRTYRDRNVGKEIEKISNRQEQMIFQPN